MKKAISVVLTALMSISALPPVYAGAEDTNSAVCIYVSADNGDDANDGSFNSPFHTVAKAKEYIRTLNDDMSSDIIVYLREGCYSFDETLSFTAEDSGNNGFNIIYTNYENERVEFSGGMQVDGWEMYDAQKNIYRAQIGTEISTRQFYVNGDFKQRARSKGTLANSKFAYPDGTAEADMTVKNSIGYTTTDTFLADWKNQSYIEFVYNIRYITSRCLVESINNQDGETALITMATMPGGTGYGGWSEGSDRGEKFSWTKAPSYYENAYELLDDEGEWYHNRTDGYIYYKPCLDEKMSDIDARVPVLEELVTIDGDGDTSTVNFEEFVRNIKFENIIFTDTTWRFPTEKKAFFSRQNNLICPYNTRKLGTSFYDELPTAGVSVECASDIDFSGCTFKNFGGGGLKLTIGVQNCDISDCEFYNIAGSGINIGESSLTSTVNTEAYKYDAEDNYNPDDARKLVRNINVYNNKIHDIGKDYYNATGISGGYPVDTSIMHNELYDLPYSGIHFGYGWTKFGTAETNYVEYPVSRGIKIQYNKLSNCMTELMDGGSIYLLGAAAGDADCKNTVSDNYIQGQKNSFGFIYPDNGASNYNIYNNVIDADDCGTWETNEGGELEGAPFWLIASTGRDINVYDNYSTTDAMFCTSSANEEYLSANNYLIEPPTVCSSDSWCVQAQSIIDNAGIDEDFVIESTDNRIFNGSFEFDTKLWDDYGAEIAHDVNGRNGAGLMLTPSAEESAVSQRLVLEKNTDYLVSAWVRMPEGNASAELSAEDMFKINENDSEGFFTYKSTEFDIDEEWHRVYWVLRCDRVPWDRNTKLKEQFCSVNFSISIAKNSDLKPVYIDDISIERISDKSDIPELTGYAFDDFENGTGKYINTEGSGVSVASGGAQDSAYCMRAVPRADNEICSVKTEFYFEEGKNYIVSALIKQEGALTADQSVALIKLGEETVSTDSVINTEWQQIKIRYSHTGDSGIYPITILPFGESTKNTAVLIDDLYIKCTDNTEEVFEEAMQRDCFDEAAPSWKAINSNASIERDTDAALNGSGGIRAQLSNSGSGILKTDINLVDKTDYKISVWVKCVSNNKTSEPGVLCFRVKYSTKDSQNHYNKYLTSKVTPDGLWRRVEVYYTPPEVLDGIAYDHAEIMIYPDYATAQTAESVWYFDDFELTRQTVKHSGNRLEINQYEYDDAVYRILKSNGSKNYASVNSGRIMRGDKIAYTVTDSAKYKVVIEPVIGGYAGDAVCFSGENLYGMEMSARDLDSVLIKNHDSTRDICMFSAVYGDTNVLDTVKMTKQKAYENSDVIIPVNTGFSGIANKIMCWDLETMTPLTDCITKKAD